MKNKNLRLLSLLAMSFLTITSCEGQNPSTPANSNSEAVSQEEVNNSENSQNSQNEESASQSENNSEQSEVSNPSESESVVAQEYVIYVIGNDNVTYECVKNAVAGDLVEVKVNAKSGYQVVSVEMNGKACTGSDGVYRFVMPNDSAIVEIKTKLVEESAYMIKGEDGVSYANLVQEGNIFVARNVSFSGKSYVTYEIENNQLSCTKIDTTKSFAGLAIPGTSHASGFYVDGNATYDFYYDPANTETPCYVRRVRVNNLPSSEKEIGDLLQGSVKSTSTVNPIGVNKVTFNSTTFRESYEWNLYSDNSSYAEVKNAQGKTKAIVYKAQKGNVYEVVDSYIESTLGNCTAEERSDTRAFSGKYDIVDNRTSGHRKYQYTKDEVNKDANAFSHNPESLYMDCYQAISNGYVNNIYNDVDVIGGYIDADTLLPIDGSGFKAEYVGNDGDFKVSANTYVRWQNSTVYDMATAYITFQLDILFDKAGSIKEGSYIETSFDAKQYDQASGRFLTDKDSVDPDVELSFTYEYGDAKAGQPDVDVSKYFTQEITNIKVTSKTGVEDTLSVGEELTCYDPSDSNSYPGKYVVEFDCLPETALDRWQYGLQASSNTAVIAQKNSYSPFDFVAIGGGDSTITIGNHTANANTITAEKVVSVGAVGYMRDIYMNTTFGTGYYYDTIYANKGDIIAGRKYTIQIEGKTITSDTVRNYMGLEFVGDDNGELLTLSYDDTTGLLVVDASEATVTEKTTVNIKVSSTLASPTDWRNSDLLFTIYPGSKIPSSITGQWNYEDQAAHQDYVVFTATQGTLYYYNEDATVTEYVFKYTYNADTGDITASLQSIGGKPVSAFNTYVLGFTFESETSLGIAIAKVTYSADEEGEYVSDYEMIMGGATVDEDGYVTFTSWEFYVKQ